MKNSFRKFVLYPLAALMSFAGVFAYAQDRFSVPAGLFTAGNMAYFIDNVSIGGTSALVASSTGIQVGASGTELTQILVATATVTSVAVAGNQCDEVAYTVTGLSTSDKVIVNPAYNMEAEPVFIAAARASATNELDVIFCNVNSAQADPVTGTLNVIAFRS